MARYVSRRYRYPAMLLRGKKRKVRRDSLRIFILPKRTHWPLNLMLPRRYRKNAP